MLHFKILEELTFILKFTIPIISANLNTYVISYIRNYDPSITYADWVLVSQAKTFAIGLLMPVNGHLAKKIGPKRCILLGSIIYT